MEAIVFNEAPPRVQSLGVCQQGGLFLVSLNIRVKRPSKGHQNTGSWCKEFNSALTSHEQKG